jgi:hypothetical protein
MLQNKYLPVFHYVERHSVLVHALPQEIYPLVNDLDFRESRLIKFLFALRGMSSGMARKDGLLRNRFVELERIANEEIIIGLIGQFWRPTGNLQKFEPKQFADFQTNGFSKGTWNFRIIPQKNGMSEVETETRIYCLDEKTLKKFSRYWFFIRPFSGIIREEILKLIKKKAEQKSAVNMSN